MNGNVYKNFGMGVIIKGINCGVVELIKNGTLRRFGHMLKINEEF